ncbi:DUF3857 and transglutaminase domain-containing protein [Lysobacter firmicutimachus]|uniref:DUF3857 and transglutaminase domain-containing protein n=1 Tax=Lysobacter firmicutimachus TaxID=1792846 RepID=A0ABU8D8Y4_9GAMM
MTDHRRTDFARAWTAPIVLGCSIALPAGAMQAADAPNWTAESVATEIELDSDGSDTTTTTSVFRINSLRGAEELGIENFAYSKSSGEVEILEAYVVTPEGKRIDVAKAQIYEASGDAGTQTGVDSDAAVRTVVFPQLAAGSSRHTKVRYRNRPDRTGRFDRFYAASPYIAIADNRVSISVPRAMRIGFDHQGWEPEATASSADRTVRAWRWSNPTPMGYEPNTVEDYSVNPRLYISSYRSREEIGDRYYEGVRGKAAITPAIRARVATITRGLNDPMARAKAITRWVASQVRYTSLKVDLSSAQVPRAADEVLRTMYGDCKDKATLLQAMLEVAGVDSVQALVRLDGVFPNSAAAPVRAEFDHVINYFPQWDTFVDSTIAYADFGVLSPESAGKPALLVAARPGLVRERRLPHPRPAELGIDIEETIVVDAAGGADWTTVRRFSAAQSIERRAMMAQRSQAERDRDFAKTAADQGFIATGTLRTTALESVQEPYVETMTMKVSNYLDKYQGVIRTPDFEVPVLPDPEQRKTAFRCSTGQMKVRRTIRLPDSVELVQTPKDASFENAMGRISAKYVRQGNQVRSDIEMTVNGKPGAVCAKELASQWQALAAAANAAVQGAIVYR